MATKNDITGDSIQSGKGNPKAYKENLGKINQVVLQIVNIL